MFFFRQQCNHISNLSTKKLVYKEFPCLQNEWTYKIRNAEPPTFAKLRKLNRITQLEELYGHLLDQQNMDTNDTPNYEP